jgi:Spherulation-specific family 4
MKLLFSLTNLRKIALVSVFAFSTTCWGQVLAIPSYVQPGDPVWEQWQNAKSVGIMIVNLNNGDDTTFYPDVLAAVRKTQQKGISVLAYTYTGYGTRDPNVVKSKVKAAFDNYRVDGIFFDEVPTSCEAGGLYAKDNLEYYRRLTDYARNFEGPAITVLNPGTQPPTDCGWMSIASILVTFEDATYTTYKDTYVDYPWMHVYGRERFWHLIYSVPGETEMKKTLELARQRRAGWVYVTDDGPDGNPWDDVPSYWAAEARGVSMCKYFAPSWYKTFRQCCIAEGDRSK